MCGIAGVFDFRGNDISGFSVLSQKFRKKLQQRGPDTNGEYIADNVLLSHTRLSVIDTSERASQPMRSEDGLCTIIFNGEIFNFKSLRTELVQKGYVFQSDSDTEVVLKLYLEKGESFLSSLNGFFALAIYDSREKKLIVARDRYGIKPLLFYQDEDGFVFASEMKALLEALQPQEIDHASLRMYFRLTYIPPPGTIFKNVFKLIPGCFLIVSADGIEKKCFDTLSNVQDKPRFRGDYHDACVKLNTLLDESVQSQMISDVPLGCFLSGGIDSSVITAFASKHTAHLNTFTIGYKDEPFYDETRYANLVAEHFKTNHHSFSLSNDDLLNAVEDMLLYIDEPFADSSALPVFILSRETRKYVTVALSGDGADEMFGGYNKHLAEQRIRRKRPVDWLLRSGTMFFNSLPASRSGRFSNQVRKLQKYLKVSKLSAKERYLLLSSFNSYSLIDRLVISYKLHDELEERWDALASEIDDSGIGIDDVLLSDMQMVLTGDMLMKVDLMSMANSLEVRPPFLDTNIVDFAFSLPSDFKVKDGKNKRILRDAFSKLLPDEILKRSKHGFEVPMNKWFKTDMRPMIDRYLLSYGFIEHQGLFRQDVIRKIVDYALKVEHHDLQPFIWSLLVFQHWYEQNEHHIKKDWL